MSSTKLFPIEANNLKHIELLDKFEKTHNISTPLGTYRQEERDELESSNAFTMELVLQEKEQIEDICHISGFKDVKQCTISFITKDKKKRKIFSMATDYAIENIFLFFLSFVINEIVHCLTSLNPLI